MKEEYNALVWFIVLLGLLTFIGGYLTYLVLYWYENPEEYIRYLENYPDNIWPLFPTPGTPEEARCHLLLQVYFGISLIIIVILVLYVNIIYKKELSEKEKEAKI